MKRFKQTAIKEAFDNLPSGICYFDKNGLVKLCNYQMHRLIFALTGKDLQSLSELHNFLMNHSTAQNVFLLENGEAWKFSIEKITTQYGTDYTQVIASNVTELYHRKKELEADNRKLKEYAQRMHSLSANILQLIRDEEVLTMKMRIHDDIGRSVIATRRFLQQNRPMEELDLTTWKNAVRMLRHESESIEKEETFSRLKYDAKRLGIQLLLDGVLPEEPVSKEVFIDAIRECMTNAVKHAGADKLYISLHCGETMHSITITNNGTVPKEKIKESGGLSSLRVRVRIKGGTMIVQSMPRFELAVSIPNKMEESL